MSEPNFGNQPLHIDLLGDLQGEKVGSRPETLAAITEKKIGAVVDADDELRKKVTNYLLLLFIISNLSVIIVVAMLTYVDYGISHEIVSRATTQPAVLEKLMGSADIFEKSRSINSGVVMALIGATTVQVGAGVLTITQYLFPKRS